MTDTQLTEATLVNSSSVHHHDQDERLPNRLGTAPTLVHLLDLYRPGGEELRVRFVNLLYLCARSIASAGSQWHRKGEQDRRKSTTAPSLV